MSNDLPDNKESRASVIASVKTYLGFFALVILVAEAILGFLAAKATGTDFTILVIVMAVVPLAAIICVFVLSMQSKAKEEPAAAPVPPEFIKHEVFLSSPMAAFTADGDYKKNREDVLKLANSFRKECLFKSIIFTGKEIASIADFEAADISAQDDIRALKESKYFVLHYSQKIVSSVLFEAGVALALHKPSLYLVKDRKDLPFLMREAEQAFPGRVKIYEGATVDEFIELIQLHRERLFPRIGDDN